MNFPIELPGHILQLAANRKIDPAHISEQHTHGHGPGGMKKNKTVNCVELTHNPTGITVRYQHNRGLDQNRKEAYALLITKIEEFYKGFEDELNKMQHKEEASRRGRPRKVKEKSEIKKLRRKML